MGRTHAVVPFLGRVVPLLGRTPAGADFLSMETSFTQKTLRQRKFNSLEEYQ